MSLTQRQPGFFPKECSKWDSLSDRERAGPALGVLPSGVGRQTSSELGGAAGVRARGGRRSYTVLAGLLAQKQSSG